MYNKKPKDLGLVDVHSDEHFNYIYLPIKFPGFYELTLEPRLKFCEELCGIAACNFVGEYGFDRYYESYLYLTAKHQYQREASFNRPGWHSDGFGTSDINYIWSNTQPTVFNNSNFQLSTDDTLSMEQMEEQALPENDFVYPNGHLLRLDQYSIHRVGDFEKGNRLFFKISVSIDKYKLKGNSINYLMNYNWEYEDRNTTRNMPQKL